MEINWGIVVFDGLFSALLAVCVAEAFPQLPTRRKIALAGLVIVPFVSIMTAIATH